MTDSRPSRGRTRALVAFGLVALPAVGSVFVVPAIAGAAGPAVVRVNDDEPGEDQDVIAFLDAAYGYDDAVALAERWGVTDPFAVKVEAGGYLRNGFALADSPRANAAADDGLSDAALAEVFGAFGYTAEDAAVLAGQWDVAVPEAKVRAGRELKTVGVLPHVDVLTPVDADAVRVEAFFAAGYDYADAEVLATAWGLATPYDAKVEAGRVLQGGGTLDGVAPGDG